MKFKLPAALLAAVAVICIYLLYSTYDDVRKSEIEKLNLRQASQAGQAVAAIEGDIEQLIAVMETAAQARGIIDLDDRGKEILRLYYERSGNEVESISRIDAHGRLIHTIPFDPKFIGVSVSHRDFFQRMKKTGKPTVSDLTTSLKGVSGVIIHVPVFKGGVFDGSIAAVISPEVLAEKYLKGIRIGENGYAWLISRGGVELYCPVPGHAGKTVYETSAAFPDVIDMAERMMAGQEGITTYRYDRVRDNVTETITKHAVYMPVHVGDTLWSVVVATPEDEALGGMKGFRNSWILICALLIVGIFSASYFIIKAWTTAAEVERHRTTAEALRHSEALLKSTLQVSPAGIGLVVNRNVQWSNEQLSAITGYSRDELAGRSARMLYPDDKEFDRVGREKYPEVRKGGIGSLETIWVRKDGAIREIYLRFKAIDPENLEAGIVFTALDMTERNQAEKKYQSILAEIDEFYYEVDLKGTLTYFNDALCKVFGYPPQEMLGKNNRDYTSPETAAKMYRIFNEVYRTGKTARVTDYEIIMKDGARRALEVSAALVRDEKGNPVGFRGLGRDVTDRKAAETALMESEERYRVAAMSTGQLVYDCDTATGRIRWAGAIEEITGYSPEEFSAFGAREWEAMIHPDDRDRVLRELTTRLQNNMPRVSEHRFRRKNGTFADIEDRGDFLDRADPARHRLIGTMKDITERKRAEEALRLSKEQYRNIFANTLIGIFQSSPQGRYIRVNPAFAKMFGYESPEEVIASIDNIGSQIFVDAEDRRRALHILQKTGILERFETRTYRKDGSVMWNVINSRAVRDEKGAIAYIEGLIEDITERKHAEDEKARLELQLVHAQKMEAVGTLAGGIAHDFNNILSAIIGYAELSLQDIRDKEHRWNLSQILSACSRAKNLVNQILAFSRQAEQERKPLDLVPLAKEVMKFLRSSLPATIDVRFESDARSNTVLADPTQVHQVIMNLCTNAAHAMRAAGGQLRIKIDHAAPPEALIADAVEGNRPGGFVHLSVSDTGHGIEPAHQNRIFDPFFTTKAPGEGTGLGLSVVYGIVKGLNGMIHVQSTPRRGSTFHIYLPAVAAPHAEPTSTVESVPRGNESILFVDDEGHLVEIMSQMLSFLGYQVTAVRESPKALQAFLGSPERFDLVITDMTMPDMTGVELAREILQARPDTPIILCTGYSDLINEQEALDMGISRFLIKPLFMGDVAREIRTVLDEHGERPAS